MIRHNARGTRMVKLLAAVSLLGAVAVTPVYAADAPAAMQAAGHDAQMTPAAKAKWAKQAKAKAKWHKAEAKTKTEAKTKWSASDKKAAQ